MASQPVDDSGGYLGVASGAAMLKMLLPDAHQIRPTKGATTTSSTSYPAHQHWLETPLWDALNIGAIDLDAQIDASRLCTNPPSVPSIRRSYRGPVAAAGMLWLS